MKNYNIVLIALTIIIFGSCVSRKKIVYFQSYTDKESKYSNYNPTFQKDDLLTITVSGANIEASAPFNLTLSSSSTFDGRATGVPQLQTYLVDSDGYIDFPVIGMIKVAGKDRKSFIVELKETLSKYINNPVINIKILNYKVTVLGEVKQPGTFTIPNERLTILEALGLAGDLTIWGSRKNVILVRDKDGVKTKNMIDLTSGEVFNSEFYYLKQNDVLYVEPNKTKVNSAAVGTTTSIYLSVTSLIITIVAVILK